MMRLSKMKWSKEQLSAIKAFDENVLVNAGAGSGKTSVLSEHVIYLLENKIRLDRLLVLTFTNLASKEMKDRIRQKIADPKRGLTHLLNSVDAAHIETIDAFALFLVQKYHYVLKLPKNIRVLDQQIEEIQKRKILDEIFEEYYKKKESKFVQLANSYIDKNDTDLKDFIISLDRKINLSIDDKTYLEELKSYYFSPEFCEFVCRELFNYYVKVLDEIREMISNGLENLDDINNILAVINTILLETDYDFFLNLLKESKFPRKPRGDAESRIRKKAAEKFNNLKKKTYGYKSEIEQNILEKKDNVLLVIEICEELRKRIDIFKAEFNLYTFPDIQKMALELIKKPDICREIKSSFDYVLIDEYQDTSDIQERMIESLEKNNIFMVGDVKQSIYAFRNANCKIFQDKYNDYKKNIGGRKIDMNSNFRSREEFVDDLNNLFSVLMVPGANIIDYAADHLVTAGDISYRESKNHNQNYGIQEILYDFSNTKDKDRHDYEARIIAKDIISKVKSGYQVVDKDPKTKSKYLRPCEFKDFTIIMDRGNYFDDYKKIFMEYNIPLLVYKDETITMSKILVVIRQLLNILDMTMNEENFISNEYSISFLSVARSFLFEYDDQTIYDYIKNGNIASSSIIKQIEEIKTECQNKTLKEIVDILVDKFALYEAVFKIGDYVSNASKIEMVTKLAASLDEIGMNLTDFVTYFKDIEKYKIELKLEPVIDSDDSVKIINIHKSKGLEFSICYFPGLYKEFYLDMARNNFIVSSKFGISLVNKEEKESNFLKFLAMQDERKAIFEERLRMLYVALTRTKETAILIREKPDEEKVAPKLENSKSFDDFFRAIGYEASNSEFYSPDTPIIPLSLDLEKFKSAPKKLTVEETLKMDDNIIEVKKAAMDEIKTSSIETLELGNTLHRLLEIADYETKDVSFIQDTKIRNYVERVLKNKIFENVKNDELKHEFTFYDSKNNVNGIIDCLIIKENYIAIVDFKLKNITEEAYASQLAVYRSYIKQITNKPIRTYLLAIISGELEEIHEN